MKKWLLIFSVLGLSACGTSGVTNLSLMNEPIPSNQSRIIVARDNSLLYMAASANVALNGNKIASLGRGGSVVENISTGRNMLTVTTLGAFGNYTATFEAKAGKSYFFEVGPNESKSLLSSTMFGMAGDAVNAQVKSNTGYFQIVLKEVR